MAVAVESDRPTDAVAALEHFPRPERADTGEPAQRDSEQAVRTLTLREYGREIVQLTSRQAGALNRAGGGNYLSVEPAEHPGYRLVTARNYVGSINVAGLQVLVQPKIPLRNLFLLLEVGLRERDWLDEAVRYETSRDLLPALVSFFTRTTQTTLARGLYHSYREHHDRLIAMRGRVDFARQLARPGEVIPTPCQFTDFTADLIENSYLKAAVSRSLRVAGVQPIDRRRLMQHLVTLEDVGDVRHHHADYDRVVFTRLNEHYTPALRLARLVLANLTLQDAIGATQASSFMVDMNKLFERFVTERLQRALRGRLDVKSQHADHLGEERRLAIKPDLLFRSSGSAKFVADIKYKLTDDDARGRNPDYYQLLAYTTALDLPEGVLIYCLNANLPDSGTESIQDHSPASRAPTGRFREHAHAPRGSDGDTESRTTPAPHGRPNGGPHAATVSSVRVRHAGKVLHTYALDLSGTPSGVTRNLDDLADWISRRAAATG